MKTGYEYWSRASIRRGFFMLITLQALSAMAPLFLIIRRGPFAEGAWPLTYFPVLASIFGLRHACPGGG